MAEAIDMDFTVGPFYFAIVFDAILYGILLANMFMYFTSPKRDAIWMRVLVGTILVVETAHTAFNISAVFLALVQGFGDYANLAVTSWAGMSFPITTGIAAMLVQWFFAWRIKVITRNMWIVGGIFFFSIIQILGAIGTTIAVSKVVYLTDYYKFQPIVIVWCIGAVTADVLITTTLVYFLHKRKSGIAGTDTIINNIIRLTLETNLLTFVWNLVDLATYLRVPGTMHLMFNLTISKLYSLSLLVSLNARDVWQREPSSHAAAHSMGGGGRISQLQVSHTGMLRSTNSSVVKTPQRILIDVEEHEMADVDEVKTPSYIVNEGTLSSGHVRGSGTLSSSELEQSV
ncbi:uncharacterized protein BXZ73DRAFT_107474 [Epithele typhae]|uniref:uncharacterized protein n=1 Tax=Epithele typhae TaxID=378194 RepID=UPI0020088B42|nr:uncharacterized protein BXZ73DRAFT_107474 [Epithele typhae]KAH9912338.1 hypothetical protein BXZ73DRAFT_107474 [Epithele typhae]